jgi:apolipoprotein N-acyltransferase
VDPAGVEIAIVQGNLGSESRWRSELYGRHLDVYRDLTLETFARGLPETVFWPESAMTFFLEHEPAYRRHVGWILGSGGAELVGGAPRRDDAPKPRFWNSIYLLSPDGAIQARYDKQHLLPFMEYFPIGVDLLRRSFGRIREFTPGDSAAPLPTRAGPAGVLVCNEALLPHFGTWRVAEGAAYLFNPTNDSWVPDRYYAEHLFDIVALRAVEQRRYLVRASTTGPSAIVDPWGRIQVATEPSTRDVILGWIRPMEERSVYGRVGDLFGVLCVSATLAALLGGAWSSRRKREDA